MKFWLIPSGYNKNQDRSGFIGLPYGAQGTNVTFETFSKYASFYFCDFVLIFFVY